MRFFPLPHRPKAQDVRCRKGGALWHLRCQARISVVTFSSVTDVSTQNVGNSANRSMPRLLAADALRSDGPDLMAAAAAAASPNPYLETAAHPAAAAAANMHRITGTFADPTHESAFAAQLFRMAYPTHVLLMALVLAVFAWNVLVQGGLHITRSDRDQPNVFVNL